MNVFFFVLCFYPVCVFSSTIPVFRTSLFLYSVCMHAYVRTVYAYSSLYSVFLQSVHTLVHFQSFVHTLFLYSACIPQYLHVCVCLIRQKRYIT